MLKNILQHWYEGSFKELGRSVTQKRISLAALRAFPPPGALFKFIIALVAWHSSTHSDESVPGARNEKQ